MSKTRFAPGEDAPKTIWSINLKSLQFYLSLIAMFLGVAIPLGGFLSWARADIAHSAELSMQGVLERALTDETGRIRVAILAAVSAHEVRAEMSYQRDMQNVSLRLQRIEILLDHLYEIRDLPRPHLPTVAEPYGGHLILNGNGSADKQKP